MLMMPHAGRGDADWLTAQRSLGNLLRIAEEAPALQTHKLHRIEKQNNVFLLIIQGTENHQTMLLFMLEALCNGNPRDKLHCITLYDVQDACSMLDHLGCPCTKNPLNSTFSF